MLTLSDEILDCATGSEGALNAALFLSFLQRLVRSAKSKVFLIVDTDTAAKQRGRINPLLPILR